MLASRLPPRLSTSFAKNGRGAFAQPAIGDRDQFVAFVEQGANIALPGWNRAGLKKRTQIAGMAVPSGFDSLAAIAPTHVE